MMNADTSQSRSPGTIHNTMERILPHLEPSVRVGALADTSRARCIIGLERTTLPAQIPRPTPSFQIDRDQGLQQQEGTPTPPLDFIQQGPVSLTIYMHRRTRPPHHHPSPVLKVSSLKNETSPGQQETRIDQPIGGRSRLIPHLHEDPTSRLPLDIQQLKVGADII